MPKQIEINADLSPNLIPMVDIMFLLLLFLMISADMGQRELEDVVLPKAIVVKEDKPEMAVKDKTGERLTINVYHLTHIGGKSVLSCPVYERHDVCREESHWRIGIKGTDYVDMGLLRARLEKEAAPYRGKDPANKNISERKVMIRADASAPFGLPQKAMNVCAQVGMYKIDVGAALTLKDDGKKH